MWKADETKKEPFSKPEKDGEYNRLRVTVFAVHPTTGEEKIISRYTSTYSLEAVLTFAAKMGIFTRTERDWVKPYEQR